VARGTQRREEVERMHAALRAALPLDEILACWHDDADACECRKPKPGLLLDAMRRRGARAADCFMIGDRWRDVEAGRRAGCRTIFIDHGYRERRPDPPADKTAASLPEASEWIVEQTRSEKGADQ
jgi:D-glycero-D-manno-heptose 1,7-bisphosphate phosphatase